MTETTVQPDAATPVSREILAHRDPAVQQAVAIKPEKFIEHPLLTESEFRSREVLLLEAAVVVIGLIIAAILFAITSESFICFIPLVAFIALVIAVVVLHKEMFKQANRAITARNERGKAMAAQQQRAYTLIVEASGTHGYPRAFAAFSKDFVVTTASNGTPVINLPVWTSEHELPTPYTNALTTIARYWRQAHLEQ